MTNSITISLETYIDIGNSGVNIKALQSQQMLVTFFNSAGGYRPASPSYELAEFVTSVMYISGVVTTAGSLVMIDPDGNIPPEYNGHLLASDSTIITPEIFLSADDLGVDPPDPEPELPPSPDDGKPTTGTVQILLKGNEYPLRDSSILARPIENRGEFVQLDTLHKVFGYGSLKFPDADEDHGLVMDLDAGFEMEQNDSLTIETRIRPKSVINSSYRIFSAGSSVNPEPQQLYWGDLSLSADGTDSFQFNWVDDTSTLRYIYLPFDGHPLTAGEFSQFVFVHDALTGTFAVFVDGTRVSYVDASAFIDPIWTGVTTREITAMAQPKFVVGGYTMGQTLNNFKGNFDEYRVTTGQALYDPRNTVAAVYDFAWPPPKSNPGAIYAPSP